jgi:hypothetical protein
MYIGNGVTRELPLPPGADGSVVCLGGVRVKQGDAYVVENGSVIFSIPPPNGVDVTFEMPSALATGKCLVIYPDGSVREVSEDPHLLLAEAKAERAETKRLLAAALDASDKLERNVRLESEIAREKLTARLEKYAGLIDASVDGAAAATRDEIAAMVERQAAGMRETSAAVSSMLDEARAALEEAKGISDKSAARAAEGLKRRSARLEEALAEMAAIKREAEAIRDEARNAAAASGAEVNRTAGEYMRTVLEEIRTLKEMTQASVDAALKGYQAEAAEVRGEAGTVREEIRRILAEASAIQTRCEEIDAATRDRETGMRALWERITTRKERSRQDG